MARAFPLSDRIVEVLVDLGPTASPRRRSGSGCRVAGRTVLTAAHVVAGAHAVSVRGPDKLKHRAEVDAAFLGDPNGVGADRVPDLALLTVPDALEVSPLPLAAIDRRAGSGREVVADCQAVGYPEFSRTGSPKPRRDTVHAFGCIPVLSQLVSGLLTLQVNSSPRDLPPAEEALGGSPWSGMSGAPVLSEGHLVGVVIEHAPRAGPSAITAIPITALDYNPERPLWGRGVSNPPAWWARLGALEPAGSALPRLPRRHTQPGASNRVTPPGRLEAAVGAIVAQVVDSTARTSGQELPPLFPLAVDLALSQAITTFSGDNSNTALIRPLLDPDGLLADPEIAGVLARALAGGYQEGATVLGRAWARALPDRTQTDDLVTESENLLGYLWGAGQELRPHLELTVPHTARASAALEVEAEELRERLLAEREVISDICRVFVHDLGGSTRNLPGKLRVLLINQTRLIANAGRGFVGRKSVQAELEAFVEGDEGEYCFVVDGVGFGKTALLAHLVAERPRYARHFNVLSEGIFKREQFLNNICAQLVGSYDLPPDLLLRRGHATAELLCEVLERSATKNRGEKIVVVVDALDEAMIGKGVAGVNPLGLPRSLPENCRFIVTVRKGTPGWQPILDHGFKSRQLPIADGNEYTDDAIAYVRSRLASDRVDGYRENQRLTVEKFTDELVVRSDGLFVYLRHVLDQYDAGGDLAHRDFTELPAGLIPYYEDQFERMQANCSGSQWRKVRRPLLFQLARAERPLTLGELAIGAGLDDVKQVRFDIDQWMQFLTTADRRPPAYRLFHESFREFIGSKMGLEEIAEAEQQIRDQRKREARRRYGRRRSDADADPDVDADHGAGDD